MSLKYSSTTADYLQWSEAMNLIRKLARDSNYKMSLLIALGCFTGLRISDILALRWNQILDAEEFTITEIKTGKQRTIRINMQLQLHIRDCYEHINPVGIKCSCIDKSEGDSVHSSENQCHVEGDKEEVQVAYRQFQLPFS